MNNKNSNQKKAIKNAGQPKQKKSNVQKKKRTKVVSANSIRSDLNDRGVKQNEILQVTSNIQATDTLRRTTDISTNAIAEFFSCFLGKLIQLGVTRTKDFDYSSFYSGYRFMIEGACKMIQGEAALEKAPKIIADWISALSPKSVKFHGFAAVAFGWNQFVASPYDQISIGTATYRPMSVVSENSQWNTPAGPDVTPASADNYNYFLRCCSGLSQIPVVKALLSEVSMVDYKSPVSNDVSAFAYSYPYFGLTADGTTGYWNNAESMVTLTSPDLAKYSPYPTGAVNFVSRKFTPTSGGPGQWLSPLADFPKSYFNKAPPIIKQLDLLDVTTRLISWVQGMVRKKAQLGYTVTTPTLLNMTIQDFNIIVREMLLLNSPAQFLSQFEGVNVFSQGSNYFQPFFVTASTVPSGYYSQMKIPLTLAENLGMLREVAFKYNYRSTSKNNFDRYVPVWGYYPLDPVLTPTVEVGGNTIPMFQTAGFGGQQVVNLADGSYGGSGNPQFINFNGSYYSSALNMWNDLIENLQDVSEKISTNCKSFTGKVPYALMVTRIISSLVPTLPLSPGWESSLSKFYRPVKDKNIKLPPGEPKYLHIEGMSSAVPIPTEIFQILQNFVVPSVRIDFSPQTAIDSPQYKASVGELIDIPNDQTKGAPTYFTAAEFFAQNCVTGVGRDSNNEVSAVFDVMTAKGEGGAIADLLAGVLGQVLPSGAPVFKTIASLVPV